MKKHASFFLAFVLLSCQSSPDTLFKKLSSKDSGIAFSNSILETNELNVLVYEYFYNGGGVAAADFDNDGLTDLYFTANQGTDRIYKNNGGLKFEDKTESAGISWNGEWKTGATVVDINNDGLIDIYVSVSGNEERPDLRKNKFYINQGDFKFKEEASLYGLDCDGFTTQTAFLDYDKDGDLDAYVMNHNVKDFKRFDVEAIHFMRDEYAGDKLFRNDNSKFIDVSKEAGIKGNPIGFGLGIHVADLNNDNWPDIYISNDYLEGDYLYVNNQDGTFSDKINEMVDHTSYFSMGNDVADINNDLRPDIFTSDMLPEDNRRQKLLFGPDNYEGYLNMLQNGFHPEVMRNMLHVNEGGGSYAEIGQLAGISNTDWSWSPLIADFDNDGLKDMFISNGYLRDYTNNDFVKFYSEQRSEGNDNVLEIINKMPSTKVSNYVFKNSGNHIFENMQKAWGFDDLNITNGATYADLDNDGDLDIITNNLNAEASVFENTTAEKHFVGVELKGNFSQILNAKIMVYANGLNQFREISPNHGFQSSYFGKQHFGLGSIDVVEKIEIIYPNGKGQRINIPKIDEYLVINYEPVDLDLLDDLNPIFEELDFQLLEHDQMPVNDFNRQILLPWMYSYQGPCIAVGDINGDGIEDFYLGGGKGSPGQLMKGLANGSYEKTNQSVLKQWELCTDVDAEFFDADGDGDLDLYVVGGGYEYLPNDLLLQNRLYLNDGKGDFSKTDSAFPPDLYADSAVEIFDFDNDGDQDVFVTGFVLPGEFPKSNPCRFYINEGGSFTKLQSSAFDNLGLLKDAKSGDVDGDGLKDLILAGEWTAIKVLKNLGHDFESFDEAIPELTGLWQHLILEDFDGDGDLDLLAGNLGLNTQLCATDTEPLQMHLADFDGNSRIDPIISCYIQGESYPIYSRDEMLDHIAPLRKVYNSYESYSDLTTEGFLANFPDVSFEHFTATELATTYLKNENGKFVKAALPAEMQASPVYATLAMDINNDGFKDLVVGGNNTHTRVRIGNISANHGQVFLNDGKGGLKYVPSYKSGLDIKGEVRSLQMVNGKMLVGRNMDRLLQYEKKLTSIN